MRQALHIFRKDVRRLWPQILAVMLAIAYFAALDIRWSALGVGTAATASEYIVGAAIWLLIARTVHQESLLDENQFWLTRPYERASLLGSKIMMAVVAVSLPLFVADCLILSVQSLSVADNLGGLVLKQLLTAAWLILPPFAVASITRNLAEDAMVWLVGIAMALFAYFPRTDNEIGVAAHWFGGMTADRVRAANNYLRIADEQYAMSIAVVLLLAAIWHQYSRRGTKTSRVLFAVAVLLPAVPFPQGPVFVVERARVMQDPAAAGISLSARAAGSPPSWARPTSAGDLHCVAIEVAVGGMRKGWSVEVVAKNSTFESAGGRQWNSGWQPGEVWDGMNGRNATEGMVHACVDSAGLRKLGLDSSDLRKPISVRVSLALSVLTNDAVTRARVRMEPFDVPGLGRCVPESHGHEFLCKAPVWSPRPGSVELATKGPGIICPTSNFDNAWAPMNLLPGLSPVYKWSTLPIDAPSLEYAMARDGMFGHRPEKQIALLKRKAIVKEARFAIVP